MDIDIEQHDGKALITSEAQNHTLMTALKQAVWDEGGKSGYNKGHPYAGEGTLVVEGDDPEATLEAAVERLRNDLDAFLDAFESA